MKDDLFKQFEWSCQAEHLDTFELSLDAQIVKYLDDEDHFMYLRSKLWGAIFTKVYRTAYFQIENNLRQ